MRLGSIVLGLVCTTPALASGWVKGEHAYYAKVSYSATPDREYDALPFDETENSYGLYAEYGLPLATPTQLQFYGAVRETKRVATATGDQFVSRSFTDSELRVRHQLATWPVGSVGRLLVAGGLGAMVPTTSEEFRLGNEDQRDRDLSVDRKPLVAPIDRGQAAGVIDLGVTYSIVSIWTNLGMVYRHGTKFQATDTALTVGSGLPGNSWVQLAWQQTRNADEAKSNTATNTIDSSLGISLGLTYYEGMALEVGYQTRDSSDRHWEDGRTWTAGFSFRSI